MKELKDLFLPKGTSVKRKECPANNISINKNYILLEDKPVGIDKIWVLNDSGNRDWFVTKYFELIADVCIEDETLLLLT